MEINDNMLNYLELHRQRAEKLRSIGTLFET